MKTLLAAATVTVSLVAAGCGDDDDEVPGATGDVATTTTTTTGEAAPATDGAYDRGTTTSTTSGATTASGGTEAGDADLAVAATDLGDVLVDAGGMTIYVFTPDAQGDSTCLEGCAERWPPVPEATAVGEGLDPALLGTTTRSDGDVQATYGGWPLYRFATDAAPGDVAGQGVGQVWYVLDAAGSPVMTAP
jgi:predicted lipoprotein with Yx(FWY)xxD motif